jgi:hypothetical protein
MKRLLSFAEKIAGTRSTELEKLRKIQSFVFEDVTIEKNSRSSVDVFLKPSHSRRLENHYIVPPVWEWPRTKTMEWLDLKKLSITNKMSELERRGKGPAVRKKKTDKKK